MAALSDLHLGHGGGNYLPAVVEAALASTPMLVLTTDRPFELHYARPIKHCHSASFTPFAQGPFDVPAQNSGSPCLTREPRSGRVRMQRTATSTNLAYRKPVRRRPTVATLLPEEVDELARWSAGYAYCTYLQPQPRSRRPDAVPRRQHHRSG